MLSFKHIEKIIENTLLQSAYDYAEVWWSNAYTHSQAIASIDAGYIIDCVTDTYKKRKIIFVKCKNTKRD